MEKRKPDACSSTVQIQSQPDPSQSEMDLTIKNSLGKIPFDPMVVTCGDTGVSIQEKYVDSPITKAFEGIANNIADTV